MSQHNLPQMNTNKSQIYDESYIFKEECFEIIGACMSVHNELGNGFLEAVYQEALMFEFSTEKIPFVEEKPIDIRYRGIKLRKQYRADFVCYNSIIVEIKACESLNNIHFAQVLNYLKATNLKLGLLINFGSNKLQYKRIIR